MPDRLDGVEDEMDGWKDEEREKMHTRVNRTRAAMEVLPPYIVLFKKVQ